MESGQISSTRSDGNAGMQAVWSFWSKPYFSKLGSVWSSDYYHFLSWVLSFKTASRHFVDTLLVTDDYGARVLVDDLRLPFRNVQLDLNELKSADAEWWALGKLWTYSRRTQPFVHIDSDVFLWKPLPIKFSTSRVFAQSPEFFGPNDRSWYPVSDFEQCFDSGGVSLPEEWRWYRKNVDLYEAACCGIVGGTDLELITYWAKMAIELVSSGNVWRACSFEKSFFNVLVEQFLLAVIVGYRNSHLGIAGCDIAYLFENQHDPFVDREAERVGYTHLIAGTKGNVDVLNLLEQHVEANFPVEFDICSRMFK
jgi:hypothetical protein